MSFLGNSSRNFIVCLVILKETKVLTTCSVELCDIRALGRVQVPLYNVHCVGPIMSFRSRLHFVVCAVSVLW